MSDCKHPRIQTWRFEDSNEVAGLWSCVKCGRKFEPVASPPAVLAVPAGMALVPVQPTFDMLSALFGYWLNVSHPQHRSVAQSAYAAMLAAAPQPPPASAARGDGD